ncbi:MAG: 30S ribosomal protein S3 [Chloroflexi bacterium]|nr:30S ribosomal protein S3 [Chloroflexota bacterium]
MGHKVHPVGFRLGVVRDWVAKWYTDKDKQFADNLYEDMMVRRTVEQKAAEASISQVEIDRKGNEVQVTIHSARPGIVIGRGGQRVEELRKALEAVTKKKVRLTIREVEQPELTGVLVAKNVAEQMERRISYRRAMKQAMFRTMQAGAKGVKIRVAGRLGGAEIARRETAHQGQVPLHTLRADIDYGQVEARTVMGRIGVKVWVYRGEILPEKRKTGVTAEKGEVPQGT